MSLPRLTKTIIALGSIAAVVFALHTHLAAAPARAQSASPIIASPSSTPDTHPAEIHAQQIDQRFTAYIAQLNHVIALLEKLITRLEAAGHDASKAEIQLQAAKQQLAAAEAKAKQPVDCLTAIAEETTESAAPANCHEPIEQARDSLSDVVGTLRTSVNQAKDSL